MTYRLLVRAPGQSQLTTQDADSLDTHVARRNGSLLWLDVQTREPAEMDELGARFDFDPAAIEDVIDVEQLPKHVLYDDHMFVVLHALISAGDRIDTHEVDCFIKEGLLVTVHSEPVVGLDWLWEAVQTYPHLAEHGSSEIFAQLSEVIGRRYLEVLDEFERRVDDLSDPALDADQSVLAEIQLLRREEATIRRVLRPQRVLVASLRANPPPILDPAAVAILSDAYDVHNLVVESLASARGLLTDTLDTYRGASFERQAAATTVLTVYAAIVLPLTLITSWYGMNVSKLPAAERPWGWAAVTVAMIVVGAASWVWFARAGMVRLPRLRPRKILVRGLTTAARAPVRPFTMLWRPARRSAPRRS
jgi:magnesium transporter